MPENQLPAGGDWGAVHTAMCDRLESLGMSIAGLSRESGVSETTIRYLHRPEKRQRSTLVALSAALGCRPGYLADVLVGLADDDGTETLTPGMEQILSDMQAGFERIISKLDRLTAAGEWSEWPYRPPGARR